MNKIKNDEYLGTVEELIEELLGDNVSVFIECENVIHTFEPEDVDYIPEELSEKIVKSYEYTPGTLLDIRV